MSCKKSAARTERSSLRRANAIIHSAYSGGASQWKPGLAQGPDLKPELESATALEFNTASFLQEPDIVKMTRPALASCLRLGAASRLYEECSDAAE